MYRARRRKELLIILLLPYKKTHIKRVCSGFQRGENGASARDVCEVPETSPESEYII